MKRRGKAKGGARWTEAQLAAHLAGGSAPACATASGKKGRGKYNAVPTFVGTIKFDSKREAAHYQTLRRLEMAGSIRDLRLQVPFILAPSVDLGEKRRKPAMRYVADFVYIDVATGEQVVEDVKGVQTKAYRDRKHLMKSVHGITVREV